MALLLNTLPGYPTGLSAQDTLQLGAGAPAQVRRFLAACPRHRDTPMLALPNLASSLQVEGLWIKDEGARLGLGSFKALGGAYTVMRIVHERAERLLGREVEPTELADPAVRPVATDVTVACATDGNHGRSVAAGARLVGCNAVIFVHAGVSDERTDAIRTLGAEVVRVAGSYDDSVEECARVAASRSWHLVSDTSWPGYEDVPGRVMQGYTVLIDEALDQLRASGESPPTHVFLQAGVGGFAAAVAAHLRDRLAATGPKVIVVEPERAACLFRSAEARAPTRIAAGEPTLMAMLECYEPSLIAWRVLERCADAFLTIPDEAAARAMRLLASPGGGDPQVVSGESGAAGLAGLLSLLEDREACRRLGLDAMSRVLLVNTETATDAASYERIVGRAPLAVSEAA